MAPSTLPATRRASARVGAATRCSSARVGAATQQGAPATLPSQASDTAQCVHRLGQGWVHCAFDSVLTQCTILSHCLDHCS